MSEPQNELSERVSALEETVVALPAAIDRHFDAVDVSFAEMRELVYDREEKLRAEMRAGFERVDERFERINERFERIDGRFDRIDGRFERIEGRFDRLERKLDQFIDTQSKTNALAERRLARLENAES